MWVKIEVLGVMNNTAKILISILSFIACALIGFFGTKIIVGIVNRPSIPDYSSTQVSSSIGSSSNAREKPSLPSSNEVVSNEAPSQITPPTTAPTQKQKPSDSNAALPASSLGGNMPGTTDLPANNQLAGLSSTVKVTTVSKPVYNENNKTYTFTVSAEGVGLSYCLANDKKKDLKAQANGTFIVSPVSSGLYYVYVKDSRGNKSDYVQVKGCLLKVKPITKEELQKVLNSKDSNKAIEADFKNRVASGCQFVFTGRNDEEGEAPRSYNEILQRVSMGTWSSVIVQSVSVNSVGKLSKAVIHVNY